jgi:hypothetical protein
MDASAMPERKMPERGDVDDAPQGGVGGRSPSALSTGWPGLRRVRSRRAGGGAWAPKRTVVLRPIADEPAERVSREIGVPVVGRARWRERAQAALEAALTARETATDGPALAGALRRLGARGMQNAVLRATMGPSPGPSARTQWR